MTGPPGASSDPRSRHDPATHDPATHDPARLARQARRRRDADLRAAGTDLVTWLRMRRVGFGGTRVPGPDRWDRGQRARAWASAGCSGGRPAARDARPYLESVRQRAVARACRTLGARFSMSPATDARVFFCNSGAEANEAAHEDRVPTRVGRRSSRPSAPSTGARSARCRSPVSRPSEHRSSPCWGRSRSSRTATLTALAGRRVRADRSGVPRAHCKVRAAS